MSDTPITIAFAGPASVTPEAVKDLLNDYLGFGPEDADGDPTPSDREITLVFPLREHHLLDGLLNVFAWSEYANVPFIAVTDKAEKSSKVNDMAEDAEEVYPAVNPNAKVIDLLSHAKGEGVLVLLWGEGDDAGDEETEALLDLALANDIKVLDLTAGLDDIVFTEEEEPEVVPEPEKPARRGRRTAAAAEEPTEEPETPARRGRARKPEVPLEQPEVPLVDAPDAEEPVKPARRGRKAAEPTEETSDEVEQSFKDEVAAAKAAAQAKKAAPSIDADDITEGILTNGIIAGRPPVFASLDLIKGTLTAVYLYLSKETEVDALLMLTEKTDETPLAEAVREALEALEGVATVTAAAGVDAPKRGRGRPRREPTEEDTTAYFMDGDGIIRAATRGRPRKGETRVELTAAEVTAKTEAGLLDED